LFNVSTRCFARVVFAAALFGFICFQSFAQVPGDVKWEFIGSSPFSSGPVLGTNGLVYTFTQEGRLEARDTTSGQVRWGTNLPAVFSYGGPLVVGPGDRLYLNSSSGLHALDGNTGAEIWRRPVTASCAVGPDGTIYIAPAFLYALDPATGGTRWEWHGDYVSGPPALSASGLLFVTGSYGKIIAVDTHTGQRVWQFVQDDASFNSLIVAGDGTVLAPSDDELFAIDGATGELRWRIQSGDETPIFGLAVAEDGAVWVVSGPWSSHGGVIRILDVATGEVQRQFDLPFGVWAGGMILTGDGPYIVNYSRLYALDPNTGELNWTFDSNAYGLNGINVGPDGTLYVGITEIDPQAPRFRNRLAAVRGGGPLMDSAWPTGLQNPQQTSYWRVSGVPEITRQPQSHWAARDASTAFHFYSPVVRPLQIQWRFNGQPIAGATNDTFRIARVDFDHAGSYSVVISNEFGGVASHEAILSVGYGVDLNIVGPGIVQREPNLTVFPTNSVVTLTAVPATNRNFLGWSGDVADTTNTITITVDRNYDVVAAFEYLVGDIKWKSRLASGVHALGTNGLLYSSSTRDSCIAVDISNGRTVWERFLSGNIEAPPAVGPDGTVYLGDYGSSIWALDGDTGAPKWSFGIGVCVHTCPGFGVDGMLYLAGNRLYAVDSDSGTELWSFAAGGVSPAVGADGTVYGCAYGNLFALDGFTGRKKWEFAGGASPVAIGLDGTVYVGSSYSNFHAVNGGTGAKLWEFAMICDPYASPIIGPDGAVYIYGADSKVYALEGASGQKKWEFVMPAVPASTPALAADGSLYVLSYEGTFYALDAVTGDKKWEVALSRADAGEGGPTIGPDGTIYIEGYALHATSPPAASAWPKFHRDSGNQGRLPAHPVLNPVRSRFTPNGFEIVAHSQPGQPLSLEWSANLQHWNLLGEFVNPAGTITITDSSATNQTRRFYRVSPRR
jgi:outer membrane protein assembly factor BamB